MAPLELATTISLAATCSAMRPAASTIACVIGVTADVSTWRVALASCQCSRESRQRGNMGSVAKAMRCIISTASWG